MEFRKMVTITLCTRQQKRHWCIEQSFGLYGRGRGWDDLGEWHWNMYNIIHETSHQSRFDARYWMLGAGALGWPRRMVWGGRREEGSGWGTHVYLWWIHFDIWQNQYNIVKSKNQIKKKRHNCLKCQHSKNKNQKGGWDAEASNKGPQKPSLSRLLLREDQYLSSGLEQMPHACCWANGWLGAGSGDRFFSKQERTDFPMNREPVWGNFSSFFLGWLKFSS